MKKISQIFLITLLIYFGALMVFFIAFDTLGGLFGMEEITSDIMVNITLAGFLLFLFTWLFTHLSIKSVSSSLKKKEIEMKNLKARLYDLEHPADSPPKPESNQNTASDDTKNIKPRQNFDEK